MYDFVDRGYETTEEMVQEVIDQKKSSNTMRYIPIKEAMQLMGPVAEVLALDQ